MKTLQEVVQSKSLESTLQFLWDFLRQRAIAKADPSSPNAKAAEANTSDKSAPGLVDVASSSLSVKDVIPIDQAVQCPLEQTIIAKALLSLDLLSRPSENVFEPAYVELVNHIGKNAIIAPQFLRSYLDFRFLRIQKLVDQSYYTGWVKYRTQLLFATERFNLFQEESEGFTKLIIYLLETPLKKENCKQYIDNILATIGALSLDPARVLDILLDVYGMSLENDLYIEVLNECGAKNHYRELLGLKLKMYAKQIEEDEARSTELSNTSGSGTVSTSSGINISGNDVRDGREALDYHDASPRLFRMIARLIEKGMVKVVDFIPYISSEERIASLKSCFSTFLTKCEEVAIDLSSTNFSTINPISQPFRSEFPPLVLPDYYLQYEGFNLISALLERNLFNEAYQLLKENLDYQIYLHPNVRAGLFAILDQELKMIIPQQNFGELMLIEDEKILAQSLRLKIYPIIQLLDIGLHWNPTLSITIVRLISKLQTMRLHSILGGDLPIDNPQNFFFQTLCLLYRARCLMSANSQFSFHLWSVLKDYSFEYRYALYEYVHSGYEERFLLKQYSSLVEKKINDVIKRITKDDAKTKSRLLVQFLHSNPILVCERAVSQVEVYDNLIEPLSELVRWSSQEAVDVMTYIILKRLEPSGYKPRLKNDDITIQNWITNIGSFAGKLLRKYSYSWNQMYPLIQYIYCKLKQGVWEDSSILVELLKEVVVEELVEDISKEQLEAYAGSNTLQQFAASFQSSESMNAYSKDAVSKLFRALATNKLGEDLLVLLASYSTNASFAFDYESTLTLMSTSKDKTHSAFVSLLRFFEKTSSFRLEDNDAMDVTDDSSENFITIPSLSVLKEANFSCANAFAIARPALRESFDKILQSLDTLYTFTEQAEDPTPQETMEGSENTVDNMEDDIVLPNNDSVENNDAQINDNNNEVEAQPDEPTSNEKEDSSIGALPKILYGFFWSFDLYDIYVPVSVYESQIKKQENEKQVLEEKKEKSTPEEKQKLSVMIQSCEDIIKKLAIDLDTHKKRVEDVSAFFEQHIQSLCAISNSRAFMEAFLSECVYPRSHFSIIDALYCTKFVELIARTPEVTSSFSVVNYLQHVLISAPAWLCFDTEMEAVRIGALLESCLSLANDMLLSENKVYCEMISNKPSFFVTEYDSKFEAEDYRDTHFGLHCLITKQIGLLLSKSGSQHYQRNGLLVLNRLTAKYPRYEVNAVELEKFLAIITESSNEGVLPLAQRYQNTLTKLKPSLMKYNAKQVAPPQTKKESQPASQSSKTTATQKAPQGTQQVTKPTAKPVSKETPKETGKDAGKETSRPKEKSEANKRERTAPSLSETQKKPLRGVPDRRVEKRLSPPRPRDYSFRDGKATRDSRDARDRRDMHYHDPRDLHDRFREREFSRDSDLRRGGPPPPSEERYDSRGRYTRKRSREPEDGPRKTYRDNAGRSKYR